MEFKPELVYSAVEANELSAGDLVVCADVLSDLKNAIKNEEVFFIERIGDENQRLRFICKGLRYEYAYLVCPARNVEAYKAWKEGKDIEVTPYNPRHTYTRIENDGEEPDWTQGYYRPAVEQPKEKKYRPFKDCKELCDFWYTKTAVNVPSYAMPLIWVKRKSANCTMLITAFNDDTSIAVAVGNIVIYTLAGLLKEFTFLDGTPCGVEE